MKNLTMTLDGMHCDHCVQAVRKALDGVHGVHFHDVKINQARIEFSESDCQSGELITAVQNSGQFNILNFEIAPVEDPSPSKDP